MSRPALLALVVVGCAHPESATVQPHPLEHPIEIVEASEAITDYPEVGAELLLSQAGDAGAVVPTMEEARDHYGRYVNACEEPSSDECLIELQRAIELTGHWKLLYNIAVVQQARHQFGAAHLLFRAYLARGASSIPDVRRLEVEREIARLGAETGWLAIRCDAEGALEIRLDDEAFGPCPFRKRARVSVGTHRVAALSVEKEVRLGPDATIALRIARR
jgi:hypothetical protein